MFSRFLIVILCLSQILTLQAQPAPSVDADNAIRDQYNLPVLGDPSSSRFSTEQEFQLGRAWLKSFRGQVKTTSDPLMQDYLEELIYKLARYSELKDKRLELVIVDNPTLNAFAVPGGVIGVHNGMFLYADNEAQLASVLGHELAHISQRHFARSLDKQKAGNLSMMAGLLAGIILAATTGSDAGMAAIATGQAAAMQSQLSFSREHEQEADRLGMQTLVKAGMDPQGMPGMFDNMNRNLRFNTSRPPEFLLTHPLTDSRISDSANRARQYEREVYTDNLQFQLMKKRAEVQLSSNKTDLVRQWQYLQQKSPSESNQYGITLGLIETGDFEAARKALAELSLNAPHRIAYVIADAEISAGLRDYNSAITVLRSHLGLNPNNHALTMTLADVLQRAGRPHEAEELLLQYSKHRPEDPALWYQLAEVHGLSGNILGVHVARAEYFILNGYLDSAEKQLHYAWPLTEQNDIARHRVRQRLKDIQSLRETLKKF